MNPPMTHRGRQRGVAALAISVLLLFGITLIAFFANRGLLFEQKTSANQYRSTQAFEVAEAGLEWAVAMLNDTTLIDDTCSAAVAPTSFRKKYVPRNSFNAFSPATNTMAACRITGSSPTAPGSLVCSCPTAGTTPTLTASDEPRFTVEFSVVAGDPNAFAITAHGCVGQGSLCTSSAGTGTFDAKATVGVTVKQRTSLPYLPAATVTVGGEANFSSATTVVNLDTASNGILVDSGLANGANLSRATTIPGMPIANAVIENDIPLRALATADATGEAFFGKFFGMTFTEYAAGKRVKTVTGGSQIATEYAAGATSFYSAGDINHVGNIGTAEKPVIIVAQGDVSIKGTVYGLVYSNSTWDAKGFGNTLMTGAVIARGDMNVNANPTFVYDMKVLEELREITSDVVRVPGSWRDFPPAP